MHAKKVKAQVAHIQPLTDSVMRLILAPEYYIDYQAGQYLQIVFGEDAFSYSIANAPLGSHTYELHIRHSQDNPYNQQLFAHIKQQGFVTISLPFGNCSLDALDPKRPILFIAAGTGFAPAKAMIEQLLSSNDQRQFELLWGARSRSDLYLEELVRNWQNHVTRFTYSALLSDTRKETFAAHAQNLHSQDLNQWQILLSGPFDMVYSTRDTLVSQGVPLQQIFSDAFQFESK